MKAVDGTRDLLLTDGMYFVQLDRTCAVGADVAPALLGRRAVCGGTTLIGSVDMQRDGRWQASVAADPSVDAIGFVPVTKPCENRLDAIVALWRARRDAFINC